MQLTPRRIGLYQAAGLTVYIISLAVAVYRLGQWFEWQGVTPSPILSITVFLLTFVISAIICGALFLAYPTLLFFGGRKSTAVKIALWTLAWLVIFFAALLAVLVITLANRF